MQAIDECRRSARELSYHAGRLNDLLGLIDRPEVAEFAKVTDVEVNGRIRVCRETLDVCVKLWESYRQPAREEHDA